MRRKVSKTRTPERIPTAKTDSSEKRKKWGRKRGGSPRWGNYREI